MMTSSQHVYEVRPRKDKRGVDLISDALLFSRLCYGEPNESKRTRARAISKNGKPRPLMSRLYPIAFFAGRLT